MLGPAPYYEVDVPRCNPADLHRLASAYVIKVMHPHREREAVKGEARTLWLRRNHEQQALSFAQALYDFGFDPLLGREILALQRSLPYDESAALQCLREEGHAVLEMDFEDILADPIERTREILAHFQAATDDITVWSGAAGVRQRDSSSESWNAFSQAPRWAHLAVSQQFVRHHVG